MKRKSLIKLENEPFSQDQQLQIAQICNKIVEKEQDNPVKYLRKAELALKACIASGIVKNKQLFYQIQLITLNNWASYHQKQNNYRTSLQYLIQAVKSVEVSHHQSSDTLQLLAKTRLNISAIYSELKKFKKSIDYAEQAIAVLLIEMKQRLNGQNFTDLEPYDQKKVQTMAITYIIAFYNIGVAEEQLRHVSQALQAYQNAKSIGQQFLDPGHDMIVMAHNAEIDCRTLKKTKRKKKKKISSNRGQSKQTLKLFDRRAQSQKQIVIPPIQLFKEQPSLFSNTPQNTFRCKTPKTYDKNRYYTDEQIKILNQRLQSNKDYFCTSDEYFYQKISSALNVSGDIKHLEQSTGQKAPKVKRAILYDRNILNNLRKKKKPIRIEYEDRELDNIEHRIKQLHNQASSEGKKLDVKLQSKLKTTVYKKLIKSLNYPRTGKRGVPQQSNFYIGLFFQKPPDSPLLRSISRLSSQIYYPGQTKQQFEVAKEEIETLIDKVGEELKEIDNQGRKFSVAHDNLSLNSKSQSLANSTLKKFTKSQTSPQKFVKLFKSSLSPHNVRDKTYLSYLQSSKFPI